MCLMCSRRITSECRDELLGPCASHPSHGSCANWSFYFLIIVERGTSGKSNLKSPDAYGIDSNSTMPLCPGLPPIDERGMVTKGLPGTTFISSMGMVKNSPRVCAAFSTFSLGLTGLNFIVTLWTWLAVVVPFAATTNVNPASPSASKLNDASSSTSVSAKKDRPCDLLLLLRAPPLRL